MAGLDIPQEFGEVFLSFTHSLLEAKLTNKKDIYEFAVKHFEDMIEERNYSNQRNTTQFQRDIPTVYENVPVVADFSYDNRLESNSVLGRLDNGHPLQKTKVAGTMKSSRTKRCSPSNVLGYLMMEFSEILSKYIGMFSEISDRDKRDSLNGSDMEFTGGSRENTGSSQTKGDDEGKKVGRSPIPLSDSVYLKNVIASAKRLRQLINYGIGDSLDEEWRESWKDFENYTPSDCNKRDSTDLSDDECFQEFQKVMEEINWQLDENDPRVVTGPSFAELEDMIAEPKNSPLFLEAAAAGSRSSSLHQSSTFLFTDITSANLYEDSAKILKSAGSREMTEPMSFMNNLMVVDSLAVEDSLQNATGSGFEDSAKLPKSSGSREIEEDKWFFSTSSDPPLKSSSSQSPMTESSSVMDNLIVVDSLAMEDSLQSSKQPSETQTIEKDSECDGRSFKSMLGGGFDFLRAYLTLRMIRRVEESGDTDDPFVECDDLGPPVYKRCEMKKVETVPFSIGDVIRSWYFVRRIDQFEEYERVNDPCGDIDEKF